MQPRSIGPQPEGPCERPIGDPPVGLPACLPGGRLTMAHRQAPDRGFRWERRRLTLHPIARDWEEEMGDELSHDTVLGAVIAATMKVRGPSEEVPLDAETSLWAPDERDEAALDLDSLDLLEVVFELEDSLGLTLRDEDLVSLRTIGDLARALTTTTVGRAA